MTLLVFFCKLAVYIGVCTFSFCAARTPGRFPIPSSIHAFSCRRKRSSIFQGIVSLYPFFLVNILFTYAMYFFFLCGQKEKYQKERSRRPELPLPCQPKGLLNGCKLDGAVERCERSHIATASTTVFYVSPSSVMLTQRSLP